MSVGMETQSQPYRLGEYHSFSAAGTEFLYLVPSGSIFAVEGIAKLVIELLGAGEMPRETLVAKLLELGCSREEVENTLRNSPRSMLFSATCRKKSLSRFLSRNSPCSASF